MEQLAPPTADASRGGFPRPRPPRRSGIQLVVLFAAVMAALCVAVIVATAPASWPRSDLAVIEIDVLHALSTFWKLGPYSRFGWRHPGPLHFYLLAPLYWLSGEKSAALPAGAFLLNLGSVGFVAWAARRHLRPGSAVGVTLALAALATRADGLLTSVWNPHAVVLPLAATMTAAALACADHAGFLVAAVLGASLIAQTHVGLVPVALAAVAAPAGAMAANLVRDGCEARPSTRAALRALAVSIALGLLLWTPPLLEQLEGRPGNLAQVAAYFTSAERTGQPVAAAARAVGYEFSWIWRPRPALPDGKPLRRQPARAWVVWSGSQLAAIAALLVAWRHGRRDPRWWLGVVTLLAASMGLASATRVDPPAPDHALFWLAAVGAVGSGTLGGLAADALTRRAPPGGAVRRSLAILPPILVLLVGAFGALELNRTVRRAAADERSAAAIETVGRRVEDFLRRHPGEPPLVRVSQSNWGDAAAVVLRVRKARLPVAIEPEWLVMFGEPFAPTGRESRELILADPATFERARHAPGAVVIAETDAVSVVVVERR